jgi:glyoxylate reductase
MARCGFSGLSRHYSRATRERQRAPRHVASRLLLGGTNVLVYATELARKLLLRCALGKPKALATRPLFASARAILDRQIDVEYWTEAERIPRATLLERVADKNALVCLLTEQVDEELLRRAPALRIAATVSVGYDNIDVAACTRRKVIATNTPGVLDETTADFAWTLLLAIARRLAEGDAWTRSGTWPGWDLDQLLGSDIWGKTLGIVGLGRIGVAVARRARGFQMRVLYSNRSRLSPEQERELSVRYAPLDTLLGESDFVTLHVPLTPETRHLISTAAFEKMKRNAYLINTARGPIVDEAALVDALDRRLIAGAALDVYEREPEVHPALIARKDVILAPHLASASIETRTKMAVMAATNVASLFEGRRPPNALNAHLLGM